MLTETDKGALIKSAYNSFEDLDLSEWTMEELLEYLSDVGCSYTLEDCDDYFKPYKEFGSLNYDGIFKSIGKELAIRIKHFIEVLAFWYSLTNIFRVINVPKVLRKYLSINKYIRGGIGGMGGKGGLSERGKPSPEPYTEAGILWE